MVLGVLDSETLDKSVLMLDGSAFFPGLLLGFLQLFRGRVFLKCDVVERHVYVRKLKGVVNVSMEKCSKWTGKVVCLRG